MRFQIKSLPLLMLMLLAGTPFTQGAANAESCRTGQLTTLAVKQCANVWPPDDAKFRWPDLRATCDPKDHLCDSADASLSKLLHVEDCKKIRVLRVLGDDHLARVRCEQGAKEEYLINLDSLACHPRNVLKYGEAQQAKPEGASQKAGKLVVDRAEARMVAMRESISDDIRLMRALIKDSKAEAFLGRVRIARHELDAWKTQIQKKRNFDDQCEATNRNAKLSDDAVRAQRTCRLLAGAFKVGTSLVNEADSSDSLKSAREPAAVLKIRLLRRIAAKNSYGQDDALSARMLAFQALRSSNPGLPKSLKLIRKARESGIPDLWELHAGFVFGGSRLEDSGGGYDCSDFMASLLSGHEQGKIGQISTYFLKNVARYLASDPAVPTLEGDAKKLAACFVAVDLRAGEVPQAGDFVISNNDALKGGHVAIVKRNLGDDSILTIEATGGGANTIMSKARPLREPVPQCSLHQQQGQNSQQAGEAASLLENGRSPVRPDIFVLRLRVPALPECPLTTEVSADQAGASAQVRPASTGSSMAIMHRTSEE